MKGDAACALWILMRIRQMRSSVQRHGVTCACAVPIIRMPICYNGWKESFRKNGRGLLFSLNTRKRLKGPKWRCVFKSLYAIIHFIKLKIKGGEAYHEDTFNEIYCKLSRFCYVHSWHCTQSGCWLCPIRDHYSSTD